MLTINRFRNKWLSMLLVSSFLVSDVSYSFQISYGNRNDVPLGIDIPVEACALSQVHEGANGRTVIHIQDPHGSVSGQENLARTIDALVQQLSISKVLVEGGEGDVGLSVVRDAWPKADRLKIAKRLLVDGVVSGEEYLNLTSDAPLDLVGIEDLNYYARSVKAYADLAKQREDILNDLLVIEQGLDRLKSKFYPKEVLSYEKSSKEKNFEEKLNFLAIFSSAENHPNFTILNNLKTKEDSIDLDLANLELASIVLELQKKGGRDLEDYLATKNEMGKSNLAQYAYISHVLKKAQSHQLFPKRDSALVSYHAILSEVASIDWSALLAEIDGLEAVFYQDKLQTEDLGLIRAIDRYVGLLKKAYAVEMTSSEFKLLQQSKVEFSTAAYIGFINRKLAQTGYYDSLLVYQPVLDSAYDKLVDFYQSVNQRDLAFIDRMEQVFKQNEGMRDVVLVAGGYHTDHLTELLRQKNYSYVVLTPTVTQESNRGKYEKQLFAPLNPQENAPTKVELLNGRLADSKTVRMTSACYRVSLETLGLSVQSAKGARLSQWLGRKKQALQSAFTNLTPEPSVLMKMRGSSASDIAAPGELTDIPMHELQLREIAERVYHDEITSQQAVEQLKSYPQGLWDVLSDEQIMSELELALVKIREQEGSSFLAAARLAQNPAESVAKRGRSMEHHAHGKDDAVISVVPAGVIEKSGSWRQIIDYIGQSEKSGNPVTHLYVDFDNTLAAVKGFNNSEAQIRRMLEVLEMKFVARGMDARAAKIQAAEIVFGSTDPKLGRVNREEERMTRHGFHGLVGGLTLKDLELLKARGIRIVAVSARPPAVLSQTQAILDKVGARQFIDEIILTGKSGDPKREVIAEDLTRGGSLKQLHAVFVDDMPANAEAVNKLGIKVFLLNALHVHHDDITRETYLKLADSNRSEPGIAFEYLVNAYCSARLKGEEDFVVGFAKSLLPADKFSELNQWIKNTQDFLVRHGLEKHEIFKTDELLGSTQPISSQQPLKDLKPSGLSGARLAEKESVMEQFELSKVEVAESLDKILNNRGEDIPGKIYRLSEIPSAQELEKFLQSYRQEKEVGVYGFRESSSAGILVVAGDRRIVPLSDAFQDWVRRSEVVFDLHTHGFPRDFAMEAEFPSGGDFRLELEARSYLYDHHFNLIEYGGPHRRNIFMEFFGFPLNENDGFQVTVKNGEPSKIERLQNLSRQSTFDSNRLQDFSRHAPVNGWLRFTAEDDPTLLGELVGQFLSKTQSGQYTQVGMSDAFGNWVMWDKKATLESLLEKLRYGARLAADDAEVIASVERIIKWKKDHGFENKLVARALICDDDDFMRDYLKEVFVMNGVEHVVVADSARAASDVLTQSKEAFDLILSDQNMLGVERGGNFLKRILPDQKTAILVLFTGEDEEGLSDRDSRIFYLKKDGGGYHELSALIKPQAARLASHEPTRGDASGLPYEIYWKSESRLEYPLGPAAGVLPSEIEADLKNFLSDKWKMEAVLKNVFSTTVQRSDIERATLTYAASASEKHVFRLSLKLRSDALQKYPQLPGNKILLAMAFKKLHIPQANRTAQLTPQIDKLQRLQWTGLVPRFGAPFTDHYIEEWVDGPSVVMSKDALSDEDIKQIANTWTRVGLALSTAGSTTGFPMDLNAGNIMYRKKDRGSDGRLKPDFVVVDLGGSKEYNAYLFIERLIDYYIRKRGDHSAKALHDIKTEDGFKARISAALSGIQAGFGYQNAPGTFKFLTEALYSPKRVRDTVIEKAIASYLVSEVVYYSKSELEPEDLKRFIAWLNGRKEFYQDELELMGMIMSGARLISSNFKPGSFSNGDSNDRPDKTPIIIIIQSTQSDGTKQSKKHSYRVLSKEESFRLWEQKADRIRRLVRVNREIRTEDSSRQQVLVENVGEDQFRQGLQKGDFIAIEVNGLYGQFVPKDVLAKWLSGARLAERFSRRAFLKGMLLTATMSPVAILSSCAKKGASFAQNPRQNPPKPSNNVLVAPQPWAVSSVRSVHSDYRFIVDFDPSETALLPDGAGFRLLLTQVGNASNGYEVFVQKNKIELFNHSVPIDLSFPLVQHGFGSPGDYEITIRAEFAKTKTAWVPTGQVHSLLNLQVVRSLNLQPQVQFALYVNGNNNKDRVVGVYADGSTMSAIPAGAWFRLVIINTFDRTTRKAFYIKKEALMEMAHDPFLTGASYFFLLDLDDPFVFSESTGSTAIGDFETQLEILKDGEVSDYYYSSGFEVTDSRALSSPVLNSLFAGFTTGISNHADPGKLTIGVNTAVWNTINYRNQYPLMHLTLQRGENKWGFYVEPLYSGFKAGDTEITIDLKSLGLRKEGLGDDKTGDFDASLRFVEPSMGDFSDAVTARVSGLDFGARLAESGDDVKSQGLTPEAVTPEAQIDRAVNMLIQVPVKQRELGVALRNHWEHLSQIDMTTLDSEQVGACGRRLAEFFKKLHSDKRLNNYCRENNIEFVVIGGYIRSFLYQGPASPKDLDILVKINLTQQELSQPQAERRRLILEKAAALRPLLMKKFLDREKPKALAPTPEDGFAPPETPKKRPINQLREKWKPFEWGNTTIDILGVMDQTGELYSFSQLAPDFTINRIGLSDSGVVYDFEGALQDASDRLLKFHARALEGVEVNFQTILRAMRFRLQYGLKMEPTLARYVARFFLDNDPSWLSNQDMRESVEYALSIPDGSNHLLDELLIFFKKNPDVLTKFPQHSSGRPYWNKALVEMRKIDPVCVQLLEILDRHLPGAGVMCLADYQDEVYAICQTILDIAKNGNETDVPDAYLDLKYTIEDYDRVLLRYSLGARQLYSWIELRAPYLIQIFQNALAFGDALSEMKMIGADRFCAAVLGKYIPPSTGERHAYDRVLFPLNESNFSLDRGARLGRRPVIPEKLEIAGLSKLSSLNISQAAQKIRVSIPGLSTHLKNHPEDFEKYGIIVPRVSSDIPSLLEVEGKAGLNGLNTSQAAQKIGVSIPGLSTHLKNHPEDFEKYGIIVPRDIPSLLEAEGKASLNGLNISQAAQKIGVSITGLSTHLKNHPEDFEKYGIIVPRDIPSLLEVKGKAGLNGLNISQAAQKIGVSQPGLSTHLKNHPEDFEKYGIMKNRKSGARLVEMKLINGARLAENSSPERSQLNASAQKYLDVLSVNDGQEASEPDAFVLLGNTHLDIFLRFAAHWKSVKEKTGKQIPIVVAGGKGRGTVMLLKRVRQHYPQANIDDTANEAQIIREVLTKEGVDENFIFIEASPSKNTNENFRHAEPIIRNATQNKNKPTITIVTSPWLMLRACSTADKVWLENDWDIKRFDAGKIDAESLDPESLIEILGYVAGYPQKYAAQYPQLNIYSEWRGGFAQYNPNALAPRTLESEHVQVWRWLEDAKIDFEKYLDALTLAYEPTTNRLIPINSDGTVGARLAGVVEDIRSGEMETLRSPLSEFVRVVVQQDLAERDAKLPNFVRTYLMIRYRVPSLAIGSYDIVTLVETFFTPINKQPKKMAADIAQFYEQSLESLGSADAALTEIKNTLETDYRRELARATKTQTASKLQPALGADRILSAARLAGQDLVRSEIEKLSKEDEEILLGLAAYSDKFLTTERRVPFELRPEGGKRLSRVHVETLTEQNIGVDPIEFIGGKAVVFSADLGDGRTQIIGRRIFNKLQVSEAKYKPSSAVAISNAVYGTDEALAAEEVARFTRLTRSAERAEAALGGQRVLLKSSDKIVLLVDPAILGEVKDTLLYSYTKSQFTALRQSALNQKLGPESIVLLGEDSLQPESGVRYQFITISNEDPKERLKSILNDPDVRMLPGQQKSILDSFGVTLVPSPRKKAGNLRGYEMANLKAVFSVARVTARLNVSQARDWTRISSSVQSFMIDMIPALRGLDSPQAVEAIKALQMYNPSFRESYRKYEVAALPINIDRLLQAAARLSQTVGGAA